MNIHITDTSGLEVGIGVGAKPKRPILFAYQIQGWKLGPPVSGVWRYGIRVGDCVYRGTTLCCTPNTLFKMMVSFTMELEWFPTFPTPGAKGYGSVSHPLATVAVRIGWEIMGW